ncbi:degV family protein [Bacillus coahuilensis p1.1.43]|uniref:DegV family protein n=1 Tax=Bacillus coahuilensis p1.1.43 TaxID=1150625 RepID=A0A147K4N9_9BACI|nr:DegV family protein [Bacillus coahuilensis]KUP04391.1 degV family protein [Bacillus coahuilensis p1.1.43]
MSTKQKIAWITDSTATLSKEFIKQNHIHVIPLSIHFGEDTYLEGIEIEPEEFYKKLTASKTLPTTSQPATGKFVELYESLKAEYDYAIAIHASSVLTGTYQGSILGAEMAEFTNVEVIDSKIGSYALGKMVERGVELANEGIPYEEIVNILRELPDRGRLYMVPGSLEQLQKSGRLTQGQAVLGGLLRLKLIVEFKEGKVDLAEKIRSYKKVKQRMFEILDENAPKIKEVGIVHGNDEAMANEWLQDLQEKYPSIEFSTTILSPVAGTHMGQGTIGLSWILEK